MEGANVHRPAKVIRSAQLPALPLAAAKEGCSSETVVCVLLSATAPSRIIESVCVCHRDRHHNDTSVL